MRANTGRKSLHPWSLDTWLHVAGRTLVDLAGQLGLNRSSLIAYHLGDRVAPQWVRNAVAGISGGAVHPDDWPPKRHRDGATLRKTSPGCDKSAPTHSVNGTQGGDTT